MAAAVDVVDGDLGRMNPPFSRVAQTDLAAVGGSDGTISDTLPYCGYVDELLSALPETVVEMFVKIVFDSFASTFSRDLGDSGIQRLMDSGRNK
jgi:hypothetical protein